MSKQRPYATLLAKGEDRKQRILDATQRLVVRHGWRGITLAQIAREAGVSPAGLLHHFASKEQLLHAALDARDAYDETHFQAGGDIVEQMSLLEARFREVPEQIGTYAVLLMENLDAQAPLHERLRVKQHSNVDQVAGEIRRGQSEGRYRTDIDPTAKAVEVMAFLHGVEAMWLLDPAISLPDVFLEYTATLIQRLAVPPAGS
ncbi:TetR/AcrR family transcriptional regulator [Yinghuangia aomiensis]|uniref:TetR/AcrR family transcriptional regulator n=1 Tax=Yinghuangia aomiensis TaxID=676205 RepID=A0ABP9ICH7_9ACTN